MTHSFKQLSFENINLGGMPQGTTDCKLDFTPSVFGAGGVTLTNLTSSALNGGYYPDESFIERI